MTKDKLQRFFLDVRDLSLAVAYSNELFTNEQKQQANVRELRVLANRLARFTDEHYTDFVSKQEEFCVDSCGRKAKTPEGRCKTCYRAFHGYPFGSA